MGDCLWFRDVEGLIGKVFGILRCGGFDWEIVCGFAMEDFDKSVV